MRAALIACALATTLAACNPHLTAQSLAPPGRAARLDAVDGFWGTKYYRLELTRGVAIAITCSKVGPCEKLRVASDNPAVAEVRAASLGRLDPSGFHDQVTAAALVVVGKTPGSTVVRVRSDDGDREIRVTVVPPPAI